MSSSKSKKLVRKPVLRTGTIDKQAAPPLRLSMAEIELRSLPFVTVWIDDADVERVSYWSPAELHCIGSSAEESAGTLGRGYAIEAIELMRNYPNDNKYLLLEIARDMVSISKARVNMAWTQCEVEFWAAISDFVATGRISLGVTGMATATFPDPEVLS